MVLNLLIFGNFASYISLEGKGLSKMRGRDGVCVCVRERASVLNKMTLCIIYFSLCVVNPLTFLVSQSSCV